MTKNAETQVLRCWGKTTSDNVVKASFHPAVYHMMDVGYVAQVLLTKASPRWRNILSRRHCPQANCMGAADRASRFRQDCSLSMQAGQRDRLNAEGFILTDLYTPHALLGRVLSSMR